jgi:hypothetical protein
MPTTETIESRVLDAMPRYPAWVTPYAIHRRMPEPQPTLQQVRSALRRAYVKGQLGRRPMYDHNGEPSYRRVPR